MPMRYQWTSGSYRKWVLLLALSVLLALIAASSLGWISGQSLPFTTLAHDDALRPDADKRANQPEVYVLTERADVDYIATTIVGIDPLGAKPVATAQQAAPEKPSLWSSFSGEGSRSP